MRRHTLLYYIGLAILLVACNDSTVYSCYRHVPASGWEKNDNLLFTVPPVKQDGQYSEELGIRIDNTYPFMGLTLIIDQTVFPSLEMKNDTLNCSLIGEDGVVKGKGVSHYQYVFPLTTLTLYKGDSLSITIRHDMKREILPGVTDIGMILNRQ
mgnify:FL=1